eukprot:6406363-Prymnesium_polylepis.1
MQSPDKEAWLQAMQNEIDSHKRSKTWELVRAATIQAGRRAVGSTWAFDVKRNADGTIARYKARLLKAGTTITPTPTQSGSKTLRTLLSYAALKKLKLSGADIVTAYLNGTLEEQIHMRQPPGLEEAGPKGEPMVCLLIKSIYGLKQSGACWEARLTAELKSIGFSRCETDPSRSSSDDLREEVVEALKDVFEVKDTGDLTWLLGTAIHQDLNEDTVSLSQSLYIEDMMTTFLPDEVKTPKKARSMPCNEQILQHTNSTPADQINPLYRKGVGKLLWLVVMSRPDLAFTVSLLGRFNSCGGAPHMEA